MKDSGKMIKCKATVNFIMPTESSHIRGFGLKDASAEMDKFSMTNPSTSKNLLITPISLKSKTSGSVMMGNLIKTQNTEKEE